LPHASAHDELVAVCHAAADELLTRMGRDASPELFSLELTMGQFKAMMAITLVGPLPVGELGRRLGLSEPAASLLVDKLEERGLARRERDEDDRRRSLVTATPAAEELTDRLRRGREENLVRWFEALTDDELEDLGRGLRGLLRVARVESRPPATEKEALRV
jgi:DNA-binding MarR family transcriptional regulator